MTLQYMTSNGFDLEIIAAFHLEAQNVSLQSC